MGWTAPSGIDCARMRLLRSQTREPSVNQIIRIGMDTSKHFFQLHGVDAAERPGLRRKLRGNEVLAVFAKLRALVPGRPQLLIFQALLLVADAIDRTGPVIGHEYRTVLGQNDIVRPAEIALVTFEPAGCEHILLGVFAVRTGGHAHDARTLIFMPVPRTVLCDQNAVLVLG